jgi:hypothetical protein
MATSLDVHRDFRITLFTVTVDPTLKNALVIEPVGRCYHIKHGDKLWAKSMLHDIYGKTGLHLSFFYNPDVQIREFADTMVTVQTLSPNLVAQSFDSAVTAMTFGSIFAKTQVCLARVEAQPCDVANVETVFSIVKIALVMGTPSESLSLEYLSQISSLGYQAVLMTPEIQAKMENWRDYFQLVKQPLLIGWNELLNHLFAPSI